MGQNSFGSEVHDRGGECRPCLYVNTLAGCFNGAECKYCHICAPKKTRQMRHCKAKRDQCKNIVNMMDKVFSPGTEELSEVTDRLSNQNAYMRRVLAGKAKKCRDEMSDATSVSGSSQGRLTSASRILSL